MKATEGKEEKEVVHGKRKTVSRKEEEEEDGCVEVQWKEEKEK